VATPELAAEYRRLLTTAIESDGLSLAEPDGFRLATYGQLYSLKPRLNELMIKVKPPGA
jgi:pre-mRNA-processing factor 19